MGLDGAERHSGGVRDLLMRHPLHDRQAKDLLLFGPQASHRLGCLLGLDAYLDRLVAPGERLEQHVIERVRRYPAARMSYLIDQSSSGDHRYESRLGGKRLVRTCRIRPNVDEYLLH